MRPGLFFRLQGRSPVEGALGVSVWVVADCHGVPDPAKMSCVPLFAADKGILVESRPNRDCDYRVAFGTQILWVRALDVILGD